ncbi:MAG: DUF1932 domain-containing protein [Streptosporangiaceae bacterium]
MNSVPSIAILGLGEAGARLLTDLCHAGAEVRGFDPAPNRPVASEFVMESLERAVHDATVVLSVNSSAVAADVARQAAGFLAPGALFADLNTSSPDLKRTIAGIIQSGGGIFVDVSLMGPVPRAGLRTECLAAGDGADRFADIVAPFGMPVTVVPGGAGAAAERKLVRSIFMKGLAAACLETRSAARKLGLESWALAEMAAELERADAVLLDRLLAGSERHARRRVAEMAATVEMEEALGTTSHIARAAKAWLEMLA